MQAQSSPSTGLLKLKITDYPALANVNGSVRIALNPLNPPPDNKPNGAFYPVVVNRLATSGSGQFIALNSKCTHMECAVGALGAILPGTIICPCHQSTYDSRGRVTGGPAQTTGNLSVLTSRFNGSTTLEIDVPGLGYSIDGAIVPSSQNPAGRYRLDFPTFNNVSYEIRFLATLGGTFSAVPFSLTADGQILPTVLTGNGLPKVVFVNIPPNSGFFVVAIRFGTV